ncbi:hypothetical protein HPP92_001602 [Vanilla planifolia]|uniref:Protein phosphatase n=1 Tax=Vanilla planifolia TaxID=51239 RepID=A0A835RRE2_VANPL|nr:hypothetical protein HPP92_001602 [Vanilla planifolia]
MVKMTFSLFPKQKGLHSSSELWGRGRNVIFSRTWLFLLQPFSTIGIIPQHSTFVAKNLDKVGTMPHMCSVPSLTAPLCLSCVKEYVFLLSDPTRKVLFNAFHRNALSSSRHVLSRIESLSHQHVLVERKNVQAKNVFQVGICSGNKHFNYGRVFGGNPIGPIQGLRKLIYRCICSNATGASWRFDQLFHIWNKEYQLSRKATFSVGAAPDVSFGGAPQEEQLESTLVEQNRSCPGDRSLKLLSGSCYLPHPDKEETGGEDAHFICEDEQAIGVADGVGGWADLGVDSGQYAKELMHNSVSAIRDEPKGLINPSRVLEKAYTSTKAKGSSTACIIALTDQGIHAVNLGDSGFVVVREGCTIFRSPVQQHDFNFTYQLESDNGSDLPSSAQVFSFPVEAGDVIVAGTDGLFDNLYGNEINSIVVHAGRAKLEPQVTAQKIAALARQRAQDKNRQTPFSTAAQDAGYRYYGGKLDDITVVVSYVTANA